MKKLILATVTLFSFQAAQAHGFRFEGDTKSNAGVLFKALEDAATAGDKSITLIKGYYGDSATKEDKVSAIRCASQSTSEFSCIIAMKHDRPLDPFETYPLGQSIDPAGDATSFVAIYVKAVTALAATDSSIEVDKIGTKTTITRAADDATFECDIAKGDDGSEFTTCHVTHDN